MVTVFRRSLSLSLSGTQPTSPGPKHRLPKEKSYHVRSTSLPCRSHPVVSQLEDEFRLLRAWKARPDPEPANLSWVSSGLRHLESLHASLNDLLHLPQAHNTLRSRSPIVDSALDNFLLFVDAYDAFRAIIITLKQHASAAEAAIRRRDESLLTACLRAQKKTEKNLIKLASSSFRDAARPAAGDFGSSADVAEAELAGIIREVTAVTVSTTASLFLAVSVASSAVFSIMETSAPSTTLRLVRPLRRTACKKRTAAAAEGLESLEDLEERFGALEEECDRVFRCFINTRVTLLNILTPFSC